MCDCIQKINEQMERKHHAVQCVVGSFNNQSSHVSFKPIIKSGEPHKHSRGDTVKWMYCPFCGDQLNSIT